MRGMGFVEDWVARVTAAGVAFHPPDGRSVGGLNVRERLRPLRPVRDVVASELVRLAGILDAPQIGRIERILTDEAEHGALVAVHARSKIDQAPVLFLFGFVFGDDFYNLLEGWMTDEARFAEIDEVMRNAIKVNYLCLGQERQRWYDYTPPPGWQGLARGLLTQWYPLDYPRHFARINVAPSFQKKVSPMLMWAILGRQMMSFKRVADPECEQVEFNGLSGLVIRMFGEFPGSEELKATHIVTVALKDRASNYYLIRLESTARYFKEDTETLFDLVKSVQGVPLGAMQARAELMSWITE
jgi:hypothetical protein